ncbi:MAG: SRPBCC family protein [Solirubrobacterales bacterium]
MGRVRGSVWIDRPPVEVFDHVADERNEPGFNPEMVEVVLETPEPIGVGTRWTAVMSSRGRRTPMSIEVTAFERPTRLASRTVLDSMTIDGELRFAAERGGTSMTWEWHLRPKRWLRLISPLATMIGRRQEARIWSELKSQLDP